jgi:hypothetical protein
MTISPGSSCTSPLADGIKVLQTAAFSRTNENAPVMSQGAFWIGWRAPSQSGSDVEASALSKRNTPPEVPSQTPIWRSTVAGSRAKPDLPALCPLTTGGLYGWIQGRRAVRPRPVSPCRSDRGDAQKVTKAAWDNGTAHGPERAKALSTRAASLDQRTVFPSSREAEKG